MKFEIKQIGTIQEGISVINNKQKMPITGLEIGEMKPGILFNNWIFKKEEEEINIPFLSIGLETLDNFLNKIGYTLDELKEISWNKTLNV